MAKTPMKLPDSLVNTGRHPPPSTTVGRVPTQTLSVRVESALFDEMKDLAHKRRMKVQDAVAEMIRDWLKRDGSRR